MSQKKNKAHMLICSPLYPPHVGGLESHAAEFNRQLVRRGYTIAVFTPQIVPGALVIDRSEPKILVVRFPAWEMIPNYPIPQFWRPAFWHLWRRATAEKPAIVLSRTRFFLTSLLAGGYAMVHRVPWVHVEHGSNYVYLHNPLTRWLAFLYDQLFGRWIFRRANIVVANSRASAQFVQRLVPQRTVAVISRGVDADAIARVAPAHEIRTSAQTATVVTYVGRLIDGKGVRDLLAACAPLVPRGVRLWIIGDGPQRAALEQYVAQHGLRSAVTFFGERAWEHGIALLKVSDIVVNPSHTEGLPTTVIEAALCARAIVATDVGGTKEIIAMPHSGILVPPHDVVALRQALATLHAAPQQRAMLGAHAAHAVKGKFDWPPVISAYEALLQPFLAPK